MKAIIPGSFDPVTVGHIALVEKASRMFSDVTVLLCHNFDKKTLFSFEERLEMLFVATENMSNVRVEAHTGWLYEYLRGQEDTVLFKGVRNTVDFEYEKQMADFNFEHSGVETVFVLPDTELADVSSTKARQALFDGGEWEKFIPQNAQKLVKKFYENI